MTRLLVLCLISLGFISCGKDTGLWPTQTKTSYRIQAAESEDYSYELRQGSCTTGEQKFASIADACEGLRDDNLNNYCAEEKRKNLFTITECEGSFS